MSTHTPQITPLAKRAHTPEGIHPLIRDRWSPRSFSSRDVTSHDLQLLFEAARWSASCFGEQPWRFVIATKHNAEQYQRLLDLLMPKNQDWAQSAPVLGIAFAKRTFSHNGAPNRFGLYDAGEAMAQLALQATAQGLYVHQMGGYDAEAAVGVLGIPEDFEPGAAFAIGYLGDPADAPEAFRLMEEAPRQRKPLSELVFQGKWGSPAPLNGE